MSTASTNNTEPLFPGNTVRVMRVGMQRNDIVATAGFRRGKKDAPSGFGENLADQPHLSLGAANAPFGDVGRKK